MKIRGVWVMLPVVALGILGGAMALSHQDRLDPFCRIFKLNRRRLL